MIFVNKNSLGITLGLLSIDMYENKTIIIPDDKKSTEVNSIHMSNGNILNRT